MGTLNFISWTINLSRITGNPGLVQGHFKVKVISMLLADQS